MDTLDRVLVAVMGVGLLALNIVSIYHFENRIDNLIAAPLELQAEVDRLKFYKDLFDNEEVTLVYNGCEDMRKLLGLDKEHNDG